MTKSKSGAKRSIEPGEKTAGRASAAVPGAQERETGTIRRVLMLLSSLADYPGESAQSLAARLNLPRSTVHRLLATLRVNGFADSEAGKSFGPGSELFRIAGRLGTRMPYRKLAEPYLQALSAQFHETSILALLAREKLKMFYAAKGSPPDPMRYNIELGALEPLVWGATARVMLAYMTEQEIATALKRREPSPARQLPPDESELRESLGRIRRDGYGITFAHRTLNTVGIAAPFFDGGGEVVGSVGFLIPEYRWTSSPQTAVVKALLNAAARLSRQLGHIDSGEVAPPISFMSKNGQA
jgi:IclR family KDG regulon transcriptional repressor